MKKILMFFMVAMAATLIALGQDVSKLSISTQIFLDKLNGKIQVDNESLRDAKLKGLTPVAGSFEAAVRESQFVADPIELNGQTYMSAFVRLDDASIIGKLEGLGVEIQEQFLDGKLVTALIPVDKIAEVSEIAEVKSVKAATMMRKSTRVARQKTNVDDVLTYSADAQSAGLPNAFDGSGVILGVIDTGIDFNHIAFKDKNGNSRIKKAYVYNGSSAQEYSSITSSTLTDDKSEDHGTHTSSTAGGSSVIISGSNVTVTDNHANATYGGMAPGADLYLAGINGLSDTYLSNALNNILNYADQQGKPVVVSNSWGSQIGPHDGTGDVADIYNSKFGDSHPNRVALFAASNDGGKAPASEGGGYHVKGTSSSSNPLGSILRCSYYSDTDNGFYYGGILTNAWFRSKVSNVTVKVLVLNKSTGAVVKEVTVTPSANGASVSGLTSYYSGTLYAYKDYISTSGKTQVMLYTSGMQTKSYNSSTYVSNYTLAVQIYPSSGSAVLDMWGGQRCYFTDFVSTSGYTWTDGSDDMCVSDETMIANVISIGAYASQNGGMNNSYTIGDIADFSSWATASASPDGKQYPWITAPGARLIAGVNHNHTASVDNYSYYGSNFNGDLVVNSSTNPYAYMEGTSMATPTAAGIVALWLQAANTDAGKQKYPNGLTVNDVKTIMQETAIHDSYTSGANASHFGNGKIDALAGIQYICPTNIPKITANPISLDFGEITAGTTTTKTFTVTGTNLKSNITLTKIGNNFTIDKTSITKNSDGTANATVTVTFAPTADANATYNGTVTLSSTDATSVTVSLTGKGKYNAPTITANPTSLTFSGNTGETYTKTVTVTGANLQGNISASISGGNGIYTVSPTTINNNNGNASATVTVTYRPTAAGTTSATLNLTTTGTNAGSASVAINGTAVVLVPTIIVDKTSIELQTKINQSVTQTFNVKGENLKGDITATLTDGNGVFAVSPTNITVAQAQSSGGYNVTVTFTPTVAGTYNGQIKLRSNEATTVEISLTGEVLSPTITATPNELHIFSSLGRPSTRTFKVKGQYLSEDITISLENDDNAFSVNKETISIAEAESADGCVVTVTFNPTINKEYVGGITLTSGSAEELVMIVGNISEPTLVADEEISINTRLNVAKIEMLTVLGESLSGDVTLTLHDENGVFALGKNRCSIEEAESEDGCEIPVTFTPTAFVDDYYSATVTISTPLHEDLTVVLKGYVNKPQLTADPEVLTFSSDLNTSVSKAIEVLGTNLVSEVSVTLSDPSGVFAVDKTSISISEAENVANLNVTFASAIEGTYTGTVTLSTYGADAVVVNLTATANDGGSASDAYLNIAKYATIDEAGKGNFTGTLYKFTEYEDESVAWLTIPAYGAYQADGDQNWITTSITATTQKTWNATDIFLGNSSYGTDYSTNYSRSGSNWSQTYTTQSETFFVTNCTQVKVYGHNESRGMGWTTYPAYLYIYECEEDNGSLTPSSTAVYSDSYSDQNKDFVLTSNKLDATKIYKVVVSTTKSKLYEIGFQTPLTPTTATLAQIESSGAKNQKFMISDELVAVYTDADNGLLWCKDEGNSSIVATSIIDGQIDFMRDVNINYDNETQTHNGQVGDWDQSNWIVLKFPEATANNGIAELLNGAVENNKKIAARTVSGRYIDNENYTIEVFPKNGEYTLSFTDDSNYTMNVYSPANFIESNLNINGNTGAVGVHGDHYFFMNPKIQEVCEITYAMWDGEMFVTPDNTEIQGALNVSWERNTTGGIKPSLKEGQNYRFIAVVSRPSKLNVLRGGGDPSDNYVVYPANLSGDGNIVTAINGVYMNSNCEVVGVDYVNTAGMISDKPFQGINIVVTRYSDGSKTTSKKVFK